MLVIPKLKMPTGCEECPLNYDGWCRVIPDPDDSDNNYRLPSEYAYERDKIYPGCPIYEKKPGIRILREKKKAAHD